MKAGATSAPCACDAAGKPRAPRRDAGFWGRGLLWLGLACALAPFAWALGFCFPRGDDFDEVTRAMFLFDLPGGLYEVGREWLTWSGRYTYHFFAVFLGKAAELRLACGLVCAAVAALHGLAVYGLAREAGVPRRHALPLGCLGVLALYACYRSLWAFYLLTDALTIGLQSAAALCFFWSLCALWKRCDAMPAPDAPPLRRCRRVAALVGVLATGVYEHAALAVISGAGCACVLAWLRDRQDGPGLGNGRPRDITARRLRDILGRRLRVFLGVALWCLGGLLFSFLAPGNLHRRQVRGIDADTVRRQLETVPGDWLDAMAGFFQSAWPLTAVGLALLVLLLRRRTTPGLARRERLTLAALAPAAFCLYSLTLTVLHALSDVPLSGSHKLPASLDIYAAFALGFGCFALLSGLPDACRRGRCCAVALAASLLALFCASDNFRLTLRNAVNGDMALYAATMETRGAWLRREGERAAGQARFRFGLLGELLHPGSRARTLAPDAVWTVVAPWSRPVFPVVDQEPLPAHAAHWPNQWVAWMYGVAAVASAPPRPEDAVATVAAAAGHGNGAPDGPVELLLPEAARQSGLDGAWRVNACAGPNPTFALTWLVVAARAPLPDSVDLLVPSPLSGGRLAPLAVQAWLLDRLAGQAAVRPGPLARWAAPQLRFASAAWRVARGTADAAGTAAGAPRALATAPYRYAFPLGPAAPLLTGAGDGAPPAGTWPCTLFVRLSGAPFLRLAPACGPSSTPGPKADSLAHARF